MKENQLHLHLLPLSIVLLWSAGGCSNTAETGTVPVGMGGQTSVGGSSKSSGAGGSSAGGKTSGDSSSSTSGGSSKTSSKAQGGSSSGGTSASDASGGADSSSVGGTNSSTVAVSKGGTSSKGGGSNIGGRAGATARTFGGGGGAAAGGRSNAGGATSSNSSATSAGGQTTASTETAPAAVTGLKVEANPKNVLSAFVSWTTDKPADSTVQFGQGKYEWEITDSAKVTTHKVLIIGMNASKAYQIKAISTNGGGSVNGTTTFTSGTLPSVIPIGKVTSADSTKVQPGWTLMNIIKGSSPSAPVSSDPSMAVIYDLTGQPVWYYIDGTTDDFGGAISTYLTDKGVLVGPVMSSTGTGESPREVDFSGNTIWECKDPRCGGTGDLTHDTIKLSNGNHVVLRWKELGSGGANMDSNPIFEEIDASGKVVWSLDYGKLVPKPSSATGDWCHGNSISIDIAKDEVYANCRFMGLIKTSYKNPNSLIWYLPASYGKATGSMTFSPTTSQYSDTHDPEAHDDGTILVFDNGGYSTSMMPGTGTPTYHSRAVEYKIDEAKKTATLVWEFPGTFNVDTWYKNTWYNAYYGDADRLANGNVLITAGSLSANNGDARVFEVMKTDGKVVWEFKLDSGYGVYRAERITPPLVKAVTQ